MRNCPRKLRKLFAILLAIALVAGALPLHSSAEVYQGGGILPVTLSQDQAEALEVLRTFGENTGLEGFEGDYALPNDDTPVDVIIFFQNETAAIQVLEAAVEGEYLSVAEAEEIVEEDYATFKEELSQLFAGNSLARSSEVELGIDHRFFHALNGVAMTLPANMVEEVALLPTVQLIVPNKEIQMYDSDLEGLWDEFWLDEELESVIDVDFEILDDDYDEAVEMNEMASLSGPAVATAAIVAERRTITVNLTHGEFVENILPTQFTLVAPALGRVLEAHRISSTEARLVVENRATLGSVHHIAAHSNAFVGAVTGFSRVPVTVLGVPYAGNQSGRYRMNVAELHERGIDGTGVLVAVVDSGVDWMHPAFRDTFPTQAEMAARGVILTRDEMINFGTTANPDFRFVGRDITRTRTGTVAGGGPNVRWQGNPTNLPWYWPVGHPRAGTLRPGHDPMETAPFNFLPEFRGPQVNATTLAVPPAIAMPAWSNHGTHVHGSVNSRPYAAHGDVGLRDFDVYSMGVAPGARGIHYRISWQGGSQAGSMIMAYEMAIEDGADVVTMSIGGGIAGIDGSLGLAYTRLSLAFPYVIFTTSAGNSGPQYATQGTPGQAVGMVSISAFSEPADGVYLQSPHGNIVDGVVVFMTPPTRDAMNATAIPNRVTIDNPLVSTHVANTDTGNFRIFGLPVIAGVSAGAAVTPVGSGLEPEFEALVDIQGRAALAAAGNTNPTPEEINEAGRAAIAGHFVLLRRGSGLVDISANAYEFGMAGIIQITGPGQAFASSGFRAVPMFSMVHETGVQFATGIMAPENAADRHGTFHFSETMSALPEPFLVDFSSRGHTLETYYIKPELGAHGVAVLSTLPRWTARLPWHDPENNIPWQEFWRNPDNFIASYGYSQGTSMSAPHAAGGMALLVQYSRDNNLNWTAQEIIVRAMNNATPVTMYGVFGMDYEYSVFAGARQMNVAAAINATTTVGVTQTRFPHAQGVIYRLQPETYTRQVGHFSFGGIGPGGGGTKTATIRSETGGTYFLSHEFRGNSRMAVPAAYRGTFTHPATVNVPAGGSASFEASIALPANAPTDFMASGTTAAGALGPNEPPRLAGAWSGNTYHDGYLMVRRGSSDGPIVARVPFGAVAIPRVTGEVTVLSENSIRIDLGVMDAMPGLGTMVPILPLFITAAQGLTNLDHEIFTFGGANAADLGTITSIVRLSNTAVTITFDGAIRPGGDYTISMSNAALPTTAVTPITPGHGFVGHNSRVIALDTFAAPLTIPAPRVPVLSLDIFNNGPVELGASPSRPNAGLARDGLIRMWTQIDGVNTLIPYAGLEVTATFPGGEDAMRFIRVNRPWVNQAYVNLIDANKNGDWQRINLTITYDGLTAEVVLINTHYVPMVLSFDIFNNGPGGTPSRPNAGLANIRMWTQINGVNTPVTFEGLTVTARFPNGDNAMEFVFINRPWVAQHTVNFIDVRRGAWERIYLTATYEGRTAEVILVNSP